MVLKVLVCKAVLGVCLWFLILININNLYSGSFDISPEFNRRFQELALKLDLEKEIPEDEINTVKDIAVTGIERLRVRCNDFEVWFNIETKEVMQLNNRRERKRLEKWAKEAPAQIESLNTKEQMEKRGRDLVEKIRGDFPSNLSLTSIRFISTDYPKGSWDIFWYREEKGYRYPNDYIRVSINDRTGKLMLYQAILNSEKLVSRDVRITEEEAVEIALDTLRSFFEREGFKIGEAPREYRVPAEASSVKLNIVNPNYLFVEGREVLSMNEATETVLAYKVKLNVGRILPSGREQIYLIWVNARTGEVVGGDMS